MRPSMVLTILSENAPTLVLCGALVLVPTRPASATEIPPPPPLTRDLGAHDARTTLARWLGTRAPSSATQFISTTATTATRPNATSDASSLIAVQSGRTVMTAAWPAFSHLPPLALREPGDSAARGRFDVLLGASDASAGSELALPTAAAIAGGMRFDVRPEARNPIDLGGDAVDALTAAVVRTPEPGALALFALGAAGLATLVAQRRRRRRRLR